MPDAIPVVTVVDLVAAEFAALRARIAELEEDAELLDIAERSLVMWRAQVRTVGGLPMIDTVGPEDARTVLPGALREALRDVRDNGTPGVVGHCVFPLHCQGQQFPMTIHSAKRPA